jgi:hypothetical protein
MRVSPEFRELWPRQDVLWSLSSQKRIKHPVVGRMTFEYTSFAVTGSPDIKLIVYTPLASEQTAEKLDALLAVSTPVGGLIGPASPLHSAQGMNGPRLDRIEPPA